jgi:hypothetical protein
MAVRVKIQLHPVREPAKIFETVALLNTGFETEEPQILIPVAFFQKLFASFPEGTTIQSYEVAGGAVIKGYEIKQAVKMRLVTEDKKSEFITASIIVSELEKEVILNDKAIDFLGILLEYPGKGLWRFRDEERMSASLSPHFWHL